jgi:inosose dehydratase
MKIGCFALVTPFTSLEKQFSEIHNLGIEYADVTDNHDGATLGTEYHFSASASLDSHPADLLGACKRHGITLTSVCAHANLLDPTGPSRYGTCQIVKAIKLASLLGVSQVITTEGEASTEFGRRLSREEMLFSIREKLWEPVRWAKHLGIELLIEPHGMLTDSVDGMAAILDDLGEPETVGVNLDTGNCWLGGGDPLEFVSRFGSRIRHVHWKDLGKEWLPKRGQAYGCGMSTIALGDGVIPVKEVCQELQKLGFDGPTTLEITGAEAVRLSAERLRDWV